MAASTLRFRPALHGSLWRGGWLPLAALLGVLGLGAAPLLAADAPPLSSPLLESIHQTGVDITESRPGEQLSVTVNYFPVWVKSEGVSVSFHYKDLSDDKVATEKLGRLGEIPNLFDLTLKASNISDAGLANLKNLRTLKALALDRCPRVTKAGLAELANLVNLEALGLSRADIDDSSMPLVKEFTKLQLLCLSETKVTDEGVQLLKDLKLLCLSLSYTKIGDASLRVIKENMPQLQYLDLRGDGVTDAGLANLEGMEQLKWLGLQGTKVTNAGMKSLQKLPKLESLILTHTEVGDAGVADLAGLKLHNLWINSTPITSAAVKSLADGIPDLYELNISDTAVDDSAIEPLKKLKDMQNLRCERCKITEEGKAELKKAMPNLGFGDAGH